VEVVQINSSVVTIPLFGIDVPASDKCIWFTSEASGTELDNHVESAEVFWPVHLMASKHPHRREILEILVICDNVDGVLNSFKVVTPQVEWLKDSKQFLIMGIVAPFQGCKGLRVVGNWMDTIVRLLGENHSDSIIQSVSLNHNQVSRNVVSKDSVMRHCT
jgi:hypothetical protein